MMYQNIFLKSTARTFHTSIAPITLLNIPRRFANPFQRSIALVIQSNTLKRYYDIQIGSIKSSNNISSTNNLYHSYKLTFIYRLPTRFQSNIAVIIMIIIVATDIVDMEAMDTAVIAALDTVDTDIADTGTAGTVVAVTDTVVTVEADMVIALTVEVDTDIAVEVK